MAPTPAALRSAIREYGNTKIPAILAMLDELLASEKFYEPRCEKCGHRTRTFLPDWTARSRALETLIEQGWGRAPLSHAAQVPEGFTNLDELSDEQLHALLAGQGGD